MPCVHLFDVHVGEVGEEVVADQETEQHPVIYHTLQVVGELKPGLEKKEKEGQGKGGKEGEGGRKKCLLVVKI